LRRKDDAAVGLTEHEERLLGRPETCGGVIEPKKLRVTTEVVKAAGRAVY
jgi:hypothetical protein